MSNIVEVKEKIMEFLKDTLNIDDIKVTKIVKETDGWLAEAEVFEDSAFMKSIGLPVKVKDKNIYKVKLDDRLEVQSYEKKGKESEE